MVNKYCGFPIIHKHLSRTDLGGGDGDRASDEEEEGEGDLAWAAGRDDDIDGGDGGDDAEPMLIFSNTSCMFLQSYHTNSLDKTMYNQHFLRVAIIIKF